ncbi:hypothetical protein HELRODRAFT_178175 [Helobdella robusta]|uniref:PWWP domain-containing protein n=1 Tax=Helobdella robusta TaxID=6412 RepID=T1FCW2_HELRO|nr:hypothetical protein HELRODRAFT_178175 [Helobdella robusta]ESN97385.1 hypothetical protein HELRODRAFT_178175 [Helobdella robusta]
MTSITSKNSVLSPTSSQRRRKSLTQLTSSSDTTQLTSSSVATQLTSSLAAISSELPLDVSTAVSHVLSSSGPLTVTTALSSNSLSVVMPTFIQMSGSPVLSHSTLSSPLQPTQLPGKQTRKPRKKMNESGDKINNSSSSNRNAAKSGNPKKLRGGSNEKEAFFEKMVYKRRMNKKCSKKNQDSSVEQDHRHKDESDDNNSPGNGLTCGVMNESFQKYRTVTSDDDLENEGANLLRVATQKDQISKQQRKKHCSKSCELVETRSLSSSEVDNIEDMMEDDEASNEEDDDDEEEDDANYSCMDYKAYDVVWAKCHKHPWQPAMIIPSAPVTPPPNLCINMPTIPQETVDIISNNHLLKCVVFFDAKSSWKCLSVKKLLPLGVDACIDKSKLLSCKKMSSRRLMQSAYDKALMHLHSKRDYTDDGVNSQQQQQQYQQQLQQLQQQLQQQNLCGFEKVLKADDNLSNNREISTHENNVYPVDVESQKSPSYHEH